MEWLLLSYFGDNGLVELMNEEKDSDSSAAPGYTLTREKAIEVVNHITNMHGAGFDDWWPDMMERLGLYNPETDKWPSIYDVFAALGVSEEECRNAGV